MGWQDAPLATGGWQSAPALDPLEAKSLVYKEYAKKDLLEAGPRGFFKTLGMPGTGEMVAAAADPSNVAASIRSTGAQIGERLLGVANRFVGRGLAADDAHRWAKAYEEAAAEMTPDHADYAASKGRNLFGSILPSAAIAQSTGNPFAAIAYATASQGSESIQEHRDSGAEGSELGHAARMAAWEALPAILFQRLNKLVPGLGGTELALARPAQAIGHATVPKVLRSIAGEIGEESFTTLGQTAEAGASGVNPDAMNHLGQSLVDTAVVAGLSAGLAESPSMAVAASEMAANRQKDADKDWADKKWKQDLAAVTMILKAHREQGNGAAIEALAGKQPSRSEWEKAGLKAQGAFGSGQARAKFASTLKGLLEREAANKPGKAPQEPAEPLTQAPDTAPPTADTTTGQASSTAVPPPKVTWEQFETLDYESAGKRNLAPNHRDALAPNVDQAIQKGELTTFTPGGAEFDAEKMAAYRVLLRERGYDLDQPTFDESKKGVGTATFPIRAAKTKIVSPVPQPVPPELTQGEPLPRVDVPPNAPSVAIKSAATRTPGGKVFTGYNHGVSNQAAREAEPDTEPQFEQGFTTSDGRFVGRDEAAGLASTQGVKSGVAGLSAESLPGRPRSLAASPDLLSAPEASIRQEIEATKERMAQRQDGNDPEYRQLASDLGMLENALQVKARQSEAAVEPVDVIRGVMNDLAFGKDAFVVDTRDGKRYKIRQVKPDKTLVTGSGKLIPQEYAVAPPPPKPLKIKKPDKPPDLLSALDAIDEYESGLASKYGQRAVDDAPILQLGGAFKNDPKPETPITPEELDHLRRLYADRDASDQAEAEDRASDADEMFAALIPEATARRTFVRRITGADDKYKRFRDADPDFKDVNVAELADEILRYIDEPKNVPQAAYKISVNQTAAGPRLVLHAERHLGPLPESLKETQRWLDHIYGDKAPQVPGVSKPKQTPDAPTLPPVTPPSSVEAPVEAGAGGVEVETELVGPQAVKQTAIPGTEEAVAAIEKREKPKPFVEPTAKETQRSMFVGLNDMPGQQNLFDDVDKPPEGSAIPKPTKTGDVQRIPTSDIHLDPGRFQFKLKTNASGEVEGNEITGEWDENSAGIVTVWQEKTGEFFAVNGHHRTAHAKRENVPSLLARVFKEADGYTAEDARALGVEINIKEGQGSVDDYAEFFRGNGITEAEARKRGLLAGGGRGAKGRQGYALGRLAGDNLYDAYRGGALSADKASTIAESAPNDDGLQAAGLKAAKRMSADELRSFVKLLGQKRSNAKETQGDLFGFDESALQEAEDLSRAANKIIQAKKEHLLAVKGAVKRPAQAKKMGLEGDMQDVAKRAKELEHELAEWDKWTTDPKLVAEVRESITETPKVRPKVQARAISGLTVPVSMEPKGKPLAAQDVIKTISNTFGVPIRSGRTGMPARVAGIYKTQPEVVRTRGKFNADLAVISHEVAHHVDKRTDILSSLPKNIESALKGQDYDQTKLRTFEGWAEYLRKWWTGEPTPAVLDTWLAGWMKTHPAEAFKLHKAKDLITQWREQGAESRAESQRKPMGWRAKVLDQPLGELLGENGMGLVRRLNYEMLDRFERVKEYDKLTKAKGHEPGEDATASQLLSAFNMSTSAHVERALLDGIHTVSADHKVLGKGLRDVFKDVPANEYTEWANYHTARHVLDVAEQTPDYNPGMSADDAQYIVDQVRADSDKSERFEKVSQALTQLNNDRLAMLVDAGVLTPEDKQRMLNKWGQTYTSLRRVKDRSPLQRIAANMLRVPQPVKSRSREGSGLPIMDPVEATIQNLLDAYDAALKQQVLLKIVEQGVPEFGGVEGMGEWIEKVPPNRKATKGDLEEILSQLEKAGFDTDMLHEIKAVAKAKRGELSEKSLNWISKRWGLDADSDNINRDIISEAEKRGVPDPESAIALWRPDFSIKPDEKIFRMVIKGKPHLFEVSPDLHDALQGMNPMQVSWFFRPLTLMTRMTKLGATGISTTFAAGNLFRDYPTFQAQTKHTKLVDSVMLPIVAAAWNAKPFSRNEVVKLWEEFGGKIATRLGGDYGSVRNVRADVTGHSVGVMENLSRKTDRLRDAIGLFEAGPRIAEFYGYLKEQGYDLKNGKVVDKEGNPARPPRGVLIGAALAARSVTTDFTRSGRLARVIDQFVPFFNAAVQSNVKFATTLGETATLDKNWQQRAIAVSTLATLSLAYILARMDDDDYKEQPEWLKRRYWTYGSNGQTWLRVPKPHDWAIVSNMIEAAVAQLSGSEKAELKSAVLTDLQYRNPASLPPIGEVGLAWMNYSTFRGGPIESRGMQNVDPSVRANASTSPAAKVIGKYTGQVNLSPVKVDYILNETSGGLWGKTLGTGSLEDAAAKWSGTAAFTVSRDYSETIEEFYDAAGQAKLDAQTAKFVGKPDAKLEAEAARYEGYAELMTAIRAPVKDEQDREKRFEHEKYIIGLARAVLGREELEAYPNPLSRTDLPEVVQQAVNEHLSAKLLTASLPNYERQPKQTAEEFAAAKEGREETRTRAVAFLGDAKLEEKRQIELLNAAMRRAGMRTDSDAAYSRRLRMRKAITPASS